MNEVAAGPAKALDKGAVILLAVGMWLMFRHVPPVPDVASFLDGATRWVHGARLYVDWREINPPLIFYMMFGLSGGLLTSSAFVAGAVIASAITSLWVAKHHGGLMGVGTFVSIAFAGWTEFGQREHLLLIFVIPYLLARGPAWERGMMGAWAFLGVALKPHFILVVALPATVEAWRSRSTLFESQKLVLGIACLAYVAAVEIIYPIYFREIIPWARSFYTYASSPPPIILLQIAIVAYVVLLADTPRRPLAAAVAGAVVGYLLQGRFWPYHFIAAIGLTMLLCFWQRRLALWASILLLQVIRGPYVRPPHASIPIGVEQVAVFSAHPSAMYPTILGCGVTSPMRGASVAWIPGAWNIVNDATQPLEKRRQAAALLRRERSILRRDILTGGTQVIISDARPAKMYFEAPIDFMKFLGPFPGFRLERKVGQFEIWANQPISRKLCKERY